MQMHLLTGFLLVLVAGLLQGTLILPMTLVRKWSWEHTWATFSLLGMFVFNWTITLVLVPNIFTVYVHLRAGTSRYWRSSEWAGASARYCSGWGWTGSAWPWVIPSSWDSSPALARSIPLLIFFPQALLTRKGLLLLAGTALVIFGIMLSSVGGSRRAPAGGKTNAMQSNVFTVGLTIAVLAGYFLAYPTLEWLSVKT